MVSANYFIFGAHHFTKLPVCRSKIRLLCSLQNVFQMTSLALQANLQAAREIVNDTSMVFRKFWAALGRCRTITKNGQWFQKDGSISHISSSILLWLRQRFEDRLINMRCDVEWAPHSPDLTPSDLYLWGYMKDRVHENNPQTIVDLNTAITAMIGAIPIEECVRVIDNFVHHLQVSLQRQGGHLEHILRRT